MDEILISLAQITFPTPEPYKKTEPTKQQENLCYVLLQLFSQFKQQGVQLSSRLVDGTSAQALIDLQFQGIVLESSGVQLFLTRKSGGTLTT